MHKGRLNLTHTVIDYLLHLYLVTDQVLYNIISTPIEFYHKYYGNKLFTDEFWSDVKYTTLIWVQLYGIIDIRSIWFRMDKIPTPVEMVFQVKTIESFDLAEELLVLQGVLDLEWTDHRMNWSGFCPKNMPGKFYFCLYVLNEELCQK